PLGTGSTWPRVHPLARSRDHYGSHNPGEGSHLVLRVQTIRPERHYGGGFFMGLFDRQEREARDSVRPLAARMRPRTLDEFVGQQHFLGEGKLLRRMLEADRLGSVIFYGPPGTGKTSLAELIASHTRSNFVRINAASAGVKEVRTALDEARKSIET